jgi:quinol-cytochrome oxidoreductase complex cytochrome b subunit
VGPNTLLRFYVLHCVLIPLIMVLLMGIHFYRVRKDGGVLARY